MTRDYKKEREWEQQKYTRLHTKISKETGERFKAKLESDNLKYTEWLMQQIDEYLKGRK